jgi:phosphoglycolate phosphatase-like HAD superfamily hydrolase
MTNRVIVFDIDGTLANIEHRRHLVEAKPKDWKAFNDGMMYDVPNDDVTDLLYLFYGQGHRIVLCTGRDADYRQTTIDWLEKHDIPHDAIYMRKSKDRRGDDIIKVELLEEIRRDFGEPWLWFDDRNRVVNAIRAQGVRVMQVAPGDF